MAGSTLAPADQFQPPAFVLDLALDHYLSPKLPGFTGTIKTTYPPRMHAAYALVAVPFVCHVCHTLDWCGHS